jgi:hypothetical protein
MQNRPPIALPKARCTALHRILRFEEDVKRYSSFLVDRKAVRAPCAWSGHHLLFDEEHQTGAGEYTFSYDVRTHGMVIVRVLNGKIANWREYERQPSMDWEDFVGANRF